MKLSLALWLDYLEARPNFEMDDLDLLFKVTKMGTFSMFYILIYHIHMYACIYMVVLNIITSHLSCYIT